YVPADFSTEGFAEQLAKSTAAVDEAETEGDVAKALAGAKTVVQASYRSQYLNHAQLEPPSATARFNADGTLEMWLPNQAPEMFQAAIAKQT
ncbi:molybdopterin cofactor-binding domain-containing protein, partial [Acinetobacter baumannii]